jgi:hypothetical protein
MIDGVGCGDGVRGWLGGVGMDGEALRLGAAPADTRLPPTSVGEGESARIERGESSSSYSSSSLMDVDV